MAKSNKCPVCLKGEIVWQNTIKDGSSRDNSSDQGSGSDDMDSAPYFMCSDQQKCKLFVGCGSVDRLRAVFAKMNARG